MPDFAPRWELLGHWRHAQESAQTVLRAGFGMFYDRFGYDLVAQQQLSTEASSNSSS